MSPPRRRSLERWRRARTIARRLGSLMMLTALALASIGMAGASGDGEGVTLPGWGIQLLYVAGGCLIVWGSLRTRVERLESDMRERLTTAEFNQVEKRLTGSVEEIKAELHDIRGVIMNHKVERG